MKLEGGHATLICGWRFPGLFSGEEEFQDDRELVIFAPLLAPFWTGFSNLSCYHWSYHGVHYHWSNSWQWSCYLVFYQVRNSFFRLQLLSFKCGAVYSLSHWLLTKIIFYQRLILPEIFIDNTSIWYVFYVNKTYIYFLENNKTKARVQHNFTPTPTSFLPSPYIRCMYSRRPLDWGGGGRGKYRDSYIRCNLEFPHHIGKAAPY